MRTSSKSWWAQVVQNRLIALVLAMIVIVPFVASPADRSVHGIAALAFQGFAILLLATLLWRVRWDLRREKIAAFLRTGANLPILLLLGVAIVSCALSRSVYSIQETLRLGAGILLYFVVVYQFRRSEHLSKLLDTLLFIGIAASVVGFAQFSMSSEHRAAGMFGNPQLLASFLMILLPIVAVTAITEKSANRQLAAQVATVLMTGCLLLTQTRSAWLGAAASLLVLGILAFFAAIKNRSASISTRKHELVLPVMLLVVSVGAFVLMWPQASKFLERGQTLTHYANVNTFQVRQELWRGAWQMFKNHPLTGVGVGNYPVHQSKFTRFGVSLTNSKLRPSLGENAHNLYLQTLAELGLPGLLLLVGVLVAFFVAGLRRVRLMESGIRRSLLMGALAGIVAFSVDAISSPSWQLGQASLFFWLVLGLGVAALRPHSRREETVEAPRTVLSPAFTRVVAVVATLGLVTLLPSVGVSQVDGYPDHVEISPQEAAIIAGGIQPYTLELVYTDGTRQDVTLSGFSTYSEDGLGAMTGANRHIYQSRARKPEALVNVTGTYDDGSFSDSDSATLVVQ
ncbi:MAG TPA: O-antigen ligase family protein [Chthonomonadales bacterium]|nr:O-antigen ligase family protein [Chthonomonadales bacterium]